MVQKNDGARENQEPESVYNDSLSKNKSLSDPQSLYHDWQANFYSGGSEWEKISGF